MERRVLVIHPPSRSARKTMLPRVIPRPIARPGAPAIATPSVTPLASCAGDRASYFAVTGDLYSDFSSSGKSTTKGCRRVHRRAPPGQTAGAVPVRDLPCRNKHSLQYVGKPYWSAGGEE